MPTSGKLRELKTKTLAKGEEVGLKCRPGHLNLGHLNLF
jgi:hypothetical protein